MIRETNAIGSTVFIEKNIEKRRLSGCHDIGCKVGQVMR
jgi:hypothetical protein